MDHGKLGPIKLQSEFSPTCLRWLPLRYLFIKFPREIHLKWLFLFHISEKSPTVDIPSINTIPPSSPPKRNTTDQIFSLHGLNYRGLKMWFREVIIYLFSPKDFNLEYKATSINSNNNIIPACQSHQYLATVMMSRVWKHVLTIYNVTTFQDVFKKTYTRTWNNDQTDQWLQSTNMIIKQTEQVWFSYCSSPSSYYVTDMILWSHNSRIVKIERHRFEAISPLKFWNKLIIQTFLPRSSATYW